MLNEDLVKGAHVREPFSLFKLGGFNFLKKIFFFARYYL